MSGAEVTILTKLALPGDPDGDLLSKRIALGLDSRPVSDGAPCRMANGTATTVAAPDAAALAFLINDLRPNQALALGSLVHGAGPVNVVTHGQLMRVAVDQRGKAVISRTREYLWFRPGKPSWMLLDFDSKGMPGWVRGQMEMAGGFWPALLNVAPGLARAPRVVRASTSAGLYHRDTGEMYSGSGGQHVFLQIQDGADTGRALKTLHDRCWLHGLGWMLVGGAGQKLDRSLVDPSVRYPERLVFEGAPEVVPPLMQDAAARRARHE
jgi:hypothetical protein